MRFKDEIVVMLAGSAIVIGPVAAFRLLTAEPDGVSMVALLASLAAMWTAVALARRGSPSKRPTVPQPAAKPRIPKRSRSADQASSSAPTYQQPPHQPAVLLSEASTPVASMPGEPAFVEPSVIETAATEVKEHESPSWAAPPWQPEPFEPRPWTPPTYQNPTAPDSNE